MDQMQRFAVYYAPREGAFAFRANEWLGRDPATWAELPQPVLPDIGDPRDITVDPRRYGFHGTIRAPFRPAEGVNEDQVRSVVADLAARLAPVTCDGLRVEVLDGFVALTPTGCEAALLDLGAAVVEGTNDLRAPLTEAEIARRRPDRLSTRQRALLDIWGYRYYVSQTVLKFGKDACPIGRVPAGDLEAEVIQQLRTVFRQPEIIAGTWKAVRAHDTTITEADATAALQRLDPLWDKLFSAEHARIVALLVERVDIGTNAPSVRLRVDGLGGLTREVTADAGAAA